MSKQSIITPGSWFVLVTGECGDGQSETVAYGPYILKREALKAAIVHAHTNVHVIVAKAYDEVSVELQPVIVKKGKS